MGYRHLDYKSANKKPFVTYCYERIYVSGAEGDRTLYLLDANQALSQVSYGPKRNVSL